MIFKQSLCNFWKSTKAFSYHSYYIIAMGAHSKLMVRFDQRSAFVIVSLRVPPLRYWYRRIEFQLTFREKNYIHRSVIMWTSPIFLVANIFYEISVSRDPTMLCAASNSKKGNWEYKLSCIGARVELYTKRRKCYSGLFFKNLITYTKLEAFKLLNAFSL